ncbi:MAG: pilin [Patescibacteria group bacterium]
MRNDTRNRIVASVISFGLTFVLPATTFAQTAGVGQVEGFIRNIIKVLAGLAGLIATGFFVAGGFSYIMSSGNPEHLDKAKKTLLYSSVGLAVTIGAFVLSNIVTELATNAFGS